MSGDPIYISGIGAISAIGKNVNEMNDALLSESHGIRPIQFLDTNYKGALLAGEVKYTNSDLYKALDLSQNTVYSRTTLLGLNAAREAVQDANIDLSKVRAGIISSTSVGGIDTTENHYINFLNDPNDWKKGGMQVHECGKSTETIAKDLGIRDFVSTISTACSSSANAIMLGARMINAGILDYALVGGTDALTKYTLNGFKSLKILDDNHCRPFDESRTGLNLGEAAGFLVLESAKSLKDRGGSPKGIVAGFGNANDAYHQTASSPEGNGAFAAMKAALRISGLKADDIDYINAHGTATEINDESESCAITRVFGESIPLFSSTKAYTGHTLAAAGVIEAIISVLSLQNNVLFPNLNFQRPIEKYGLKPITKVEARDQVQHILSNSFGFGGNCSSLIFSST